MHQVHRPVRAAVVAALGVALAVTGLSPAPAMSEPGGSRVVINEVFGGGGNAGAPFTHDFVEIHNPTSAEVDLGGMVVEYFSAAGNSGGRATLAGSVPAGGHFLVRANAGSGNGVPLPEPDATLAASMAAANGIVELRDADGSVVDLVGYGSASRFEGSAAAPALSNATSAGRRVAGADTDDNAADFVAGAPTPTRSETTDPTDPTDPPPDDVQDVSIAQVQGTGSATPLRDQRVRTRGVVTAAFATGGFDGFYLQTPGPDTTPEASDGLFVYAPGFAADVVVPGASVEVTGTATEFGQMTQVDARAGGVTVLPDSLGVVLPKTVVPGTDCTLPGDACLTGAALDAAREVVEGEAFAPAGDFTVTDVYDGSAYVEGATSSSGNFGEIGLAARSDLPLMTPTEVVDPHDAAARAARTAYNTAHRVILDDGSSWNYSSAAHTGKPMAWHTPDHQVRVGAAVTFPVPVVLDFRFGWKLQPASQVVGRPTTTQPQFEQTRRGPEDVDGELRLATFNVLNYFTTLGDSLGAACRSYADREGDPVTVRDCTSDTGPRGAWEQEDFARQEAKIVTAINTLDADVVSVEEIENSLVVDGTDRDEAIATLVAALNEAAGRERWAYVPSPTELPADEDVIRTGLLYDPSTLKTVGEARILVGSAAFDNAREPFAQAFRPRGGDEEETFAVVVNHFKSKGSGTPDPDGQGNANADRIAQAQALVAFAEEFAAQRATDKVFLTGDFNAYAKEDPIRVMEEAGYTTLASSFPGAEKSYSFDGMSGSLDHVLASPAALAWVEEVDVWESNANETVYAQYSRHNYNVTPLVDDTAFSASDHNPEIVGFSPATEDDVEKVTPRVKVGGGPRRIEAGDGVARFVVRVSGGERWPSGTARVMDGTRVVGQAQLVRGRATVRVTGLQRLGRRDLTVEYLGDDQRHPASTTVSVHVVAPPKHRGRSGGHGRVGGR